MIIHAGKIVARGLHENYKVLFASSDGTIQEDPKVFFDNLTASIRQDVPLVLNLNEGIAKFYPDPTELKKALGKPGAINMGEVIATGIENRYGNDPEGFMLYLAGLLEARANILFDPNNIQGAKLEDTREEKELKEISSLVHKIAQKETELEKGHDLYKVLEVKRHRIDLTDSREPRQENIFDGFIEFENQVYKWRVRIELSNSPKPSWLRSYIKVNDSQEYNLENELSLGCGSTQNVIEPFVKAAKL